jgi:hypothetical protein
MSPGFEAFLVRLYTDDELRRAFLVDPRAVARAAGLGEGEVAALAAIDRPGLELAARSLGAKRGAGAQERGKGRGWLARWPWTRAFHVGRAVVS